MDADEHRWENRIGRAAGPRSISMVLAVLEARHWRSGQRWRGGRGCAVRPNAAGPLASLVDLRYAWVEVRCMVAQGDRHRLAVAPVGSQCPGWPPRPVRPCCPPVPVPARLDLIRRNIFSEFVIRVRGFAGSSGWSRQHVGLVGVTWMKGTGRGWPLGRCRCVEVWETRRLRSGFRWQLAAADCPNF